MRLPIILYCDKPSSGAQALAQELPCYRANEEGFLSAAGARCARRRSPLWINWGSSHLQPASQALLNPSSAVAAAILKYTTCTKLREADVPTLEVTKDVAAAQGWIDNGKIVLGRKDGLSGGAGIIKLQAETITTVQQSSIHFYSKYFKKTHEFRFHVFKDSVIDIQQKRRRTELSPDTYDPMIRSHSRGWVFCRELSIGTPEELGILKQTSIAAVRALGLDFGAVDMLVRFDDNRRLKKHAVCEINTRPGIEGTTVVNYADAIRAYLASYTQQG